VEGPFRRRPQPEVVVHLLRYGSVLRPADRLAVAGDPRPREGDLAQLARADELGSLRQVLPRTALRADLHDALVGAGRLDHAPAPDAEDAQDVLLRGFRRGALERDGGQCERGLQEGATIEWHGRGLRGMQARGAVCESTPPRRGVKNAAAAMRILVDGARRRG